ncbi:hypothetical protein KP77_28630 [Jeotgalibacillus alimentarius]|uniref:Transposase IS200-like domain-containing protein n=1 Tax=Jeotgalibacillus alimentarius TaxID=135826 RepID=A0A0C2VMB0_9BACL|nr:transposase [Jeotgalibacillus alimentarius]KIL45571.1 hypothetical protein KP77_28630 [Jeotgalibacillus alimentarius]
MTEKRHFKQDAYYHVIMRGNNRGFFFRSKEDMAELERALLHAYLKYPFTILAYCFMTNHYHLLIRAEKDPLGKIMAVVNRRYSDSYSSRYGQYRPDLSETVIRKRSGRDSLTADGEHLYSPQSD